MSADNHKEVFFRQGSWMFLTTFLSGIFMLAVHVFFPYLGEIEYGLFVALMTIINLMGIPSIALQTILAQQAAAAITPELKDRLTGTVQTLLSWGFLLWFAMVFLIFFFQKDILATLKINNPTPFWITISMGIAAFSSPILLGILQGQQNFMWLGWGVVINGVGRFAAVGIIVVLLGGQATGAIIGVLIGMAGGLIVAGVQTRSVWLRRRPKFAFNWKSWLKTVAPLTLGLGASQFIFSVDFIVVRAVFGENQTGFYAISGTIGRGIVMFTAPLIVVMFPKIVHNLSHGKKTNVLAYTVLATAVLCSLAAAACTIAAIFFKRVAANPEMVKDYLSPALFAKLQIHTEALSLVSQLIPWFVWCMLPLALANVLLNNLMARRQFRVVPYLLIVAVAYVATLKIAGTSFVRVIQILGIYTLAFFFVTAGFTWGGRIKEVIATSDKKQDLPDQPIT